MTELLCCIEVDSTGMPNKVAAEFMYLQILKVAYYFTFYLLNNNLKVTHFVFFHYYT